MTRRAFDDHIRDIVAETYPEIAVHAQNRKRKPRKQAIAVLLCDTDGFKSINDTQGHESGDIVLAAVAKNLHRHVRTHQGDRLQRYGGDEFVIAFQGTTAATVMARFFDRALGYSKLEAVHVMLNKVDAHGKPADIWVTLTGGVADFRMPEYYLLVPPKSRSTSSSVWRSRMPSSAPTRRSTKPRSSERTGSSLRPIP